MKEITISTENPRELETAYERFIRALEYDITKNQPINEEAKNLKIEPIHTRSEDQFNNYFLAVSKHFEVPMSVERTNIETHYYKFKCSIPKCKMRIVFSTKNGVLFLNEKKSTFQHCKEIFHPSYPRMRMDEQTFQTLQEFSRRRLDISVARILNPDLNSCTNQTIYNIRHNLNELLSDPKYIEEQLSTYPNDKSKMYINDKNAIVSFAVINKEIATSNYCDIICIDDTVGVSKLNYPLEIVMSNIIF